MCNELVPGSLADLRKKLPTAGRKDECYDFHFCESVPGEPISLVPGKKGPWGNKDAVDGHAPLYMNGGAG